MPAVALSPLEEEFVAPAAMASGVAEPAVAAEPHAALSDAAEPDHVEWHHVSDYVDRFGGAAEVAEHKNLRRRDSRRHRSMRVTSIGVAASLALLELLLLIGMQASQAKAAHYSSQLDGRIKATQEDISRTDGKMSLLQSPLQLNQWAAQLGYHQAGLTDYDDVTRNQPLAAATPLPAAGAKP